MLWAYIGLILSFAFRRTTFAIDSLQIVAASAIPALSQLAGFKMAPNIQNETLAYIGAAAIAWIVLRLICAPYFIWRDQVGEIGALKLELSKPERLELARMAKMRAKAKAELAEIITRLVFTAMHREPGRDFRIMSGLIDRAISICGPANMCRAFDDALALLGNWCLDVLQQDHGEKVDLPVTEMVNVMQAHLHGEISEEQLRVEVYRLKDGVPEAEVKPAGDRKPQSPPDTGPETQP